MVTHTFHGLRHDFASLLLMRGVPLAVVSILLGHADPGVTAQVYAHLRSELHPEVAGEIDAALGYAGATATR